MEIAGDRMCVGPKSVAPNRMENFVLSLRDNDRHMAIEAGSGGG